jgi:hypothetical protein
VDSANGLPADEQSPQPNPGTETLPSGTGTEARIGTVIGPLSLPFRASWALLNLALTALTALLLLWNPGRRRGPGRGDMRAVRSGPLRMLPLAIAVAAAALFLVTQDFTQGFVLLDGWTIVHAAVLALQAFSVASARKVTRNSHTEDGNGD